MMILILMMGMKMMSNDNIATLELGQQIIKKILERFQTETPTRIELKIDHPDPIDEVLAKYTVSELLSSCDYSISYDSRSNFMKVKIDHLEK